MKIIKILDSPIAFQRVFVTLTNSVTAALMLSQAIYWQNRANQTDGWWFKTQKDWERETGMTRRELETARKRCGKLLLMERRGVPAKCYYKVDDEALLNRLSLVHSSMAENDILDATKQPNSDGLNEQSTNRETTQETTDESLAVATPEDKAKELQFVEAHKQFSKLWFDGYEKTFGRPYKHGGAKDGASFKRLVRSGQTVDQLMAIARAAWAHPMLFNCKHAASVCGFDSRFNEIAAEVAQWMPKTNTPAASGPQEF